MPIPTPGVQLTTLTHVEDVASMLALVPGNQKAVRQMYNVCSDRCITFQGAAADVAPTTGRMVEAGAGAGGGGHGRGRGRGRGGQAW